MVVATRDRSSDLGGWAIAMPVLINWLDDQGISLPSASPKWIEAENLQREIFPEETAKKAITPSEKNLEDIIYKMGQQKMNFTMLDRAPHLEKRIEIELLQLIKFSINLSDEELGGLHVLEKYANIGEAYGTLSSLYEIDKKTRLTYARKGIHYLKKANGFKKSLEKRISKEEGAVIINYFAREEISDRIHYTFSECYAAAYVATEKPEYYKHLQSASGSISSNFLQNYPLDINGVVREAFSKGSCIYK